MIGQIDNATEYHRSSVTFYHGLSKLHLVSYDLLQIRSFGTIPERLKQNLTFLTTGLIPIDPYSFQIMYQNSSSSLQTKDYLNAFTVLSKR